VTLVTGMQDSSVCNKGIIGVSTLVSTDQFNPMIILVLKYLSQFLPKLPVLNGGSRMSTVSTLPEVADRWTNDPLSVGWLSARGTYTFMQATAFLGANFKQISFPLLLQQGREDAISSVAGVEVLHNGVSSRDKTLKVYEKARHSLYHEYCTDQVIQDLVEWLNQRS